MTRDSLRPVSGNLVFVVKIPARRRALPTENDYFPLLYCVSCRRVVAFCARVKGLINDRREHAKGNQSKYSNNFSATTLLLGLEKSRVCT
jgi:hypothetical protein